MNRRLYWRKRDSAPLRPQGEPEWVEPYLHLADELIHPRRADRAATFRHLYQELSVTLSENSQRRQKMELLLQEATQKSQRMRTLHWWLRCALDHQRSAAVALPLERQKRAA